VGIVEVIKEAYPDPTDEKGVFKTVDVKADRAVCEAGDACADQRNVLEFCALICASVTGFGKRLDRLHVHGLEHALFVGRSG